MPVLQKPWQAYGFMSHLSNDVSVPVECVCSGCLAVWRGPRSGRPRSPEGIPWHGSRLSLQPSPLSTGTTRKIWKKDGSLSAQIFLHEKHHSGLTGNGGRKWDFPVVLQGRDCRCPVGTRPALLSQPGLASLHPGRVLKRALVSLARAAEVS